MKYVLAGLCFFSLLQTANAQTVQETPRTIVLDAIAGRISCNDPRVLGLRNTIPDPGVSQKDANFIYCIARRIIKGNRIALPGGFASAWLFASVHDAAINSMTQQLANGQLRVLAFDSMAQFVNYDPDEEAFIIGHEIGHVQDWVNCQTLKAQMVQHELLSKRIAFSKAQQACEENADFYGLQYMWGAGFNPFAAGGIFGRLEMYAPNQTRGMASALTNFLSDHPISSERIKKLREKMGQLCSQPGTVCRP